MAVSSNIPQLGSRCPDFRLPATDGKTYGRGDFAGRQHPAQGPVTMPMQSYWRELPTRSFFHPTQNPRVTIIRGLFIP